MGVVCSILYCNGNLRFHLAQRTGNFQRNPQVHLAQKTGNFLKLKIRINVTELLSRNLCNAFVPGQLAQRASYIHDMMDHTLLY